MANPGYPPNPMMMGGPHPPMAPPPPMRRGTSKAVPVVVSAGLAVGVFCGLLFGLGTTKQDAHAAPSTGSNVEHADSDSPAAAPVRIGATPAKPVPDKAI